MQKLFEDLLFSIVTAWRHYEAIKGRITKIECKERVLDAKTFEQISEKEI